MVNQINWEIIFTKSFSSRFVNFDGLRFFNFNIYKNLFNEFIVSGIFPNVLEENLLKEREYFVTKGKAARFNFAYLKCGFGPQGSILRPVKTL